MVDEAGPLTDTDLALKIIRDSADEPDRVERFKREIGVLSQINHPAVLRILDWGVHSDQLFFVSELVDGRLRGAPQAAGALVPVVVDLAQELIDSALGRTGHP